MKKIIITADLGHLKAYRMQKEPVGPGSPSMELITCFDCIEAHGKMADKISDASGRFGRGGTVMAGGSGERHSMVAEAKRKALKRMAEEVNRIVAAEKDIEGWYLAASRTINGELMEGLRPEVRVKLLVNLKSDLVNEGKSGLMSRFMSMET